MYSSSMKPIGIGTMAEALRRSKPSSSAKSARFGPMQALMIGESRDLQRTQRLGIASRLCGCQRGRIHFGAWDLGGIVFYREATCSTAHRHFGAEQLSSHKFIICATFSTIILFTDDFLAYRPYGSPTTRQVRKKPSFLRTCLPLRVEDIKKGKSYFL
jgi:hypothetical protein